MKNRAGNSYDGNGVRLRSGETVLVIKELPKYEYIPSPGKRFIYKRRNYLSGINVQTTRPVKIQVIQNKNQLTEFSVAPAADITTIRLAVALMPELSESPLYARAVFEKQGFCHIGVEIYKLIGKRMSRKKVGHRVVLRRLQNKEVNNA